MKHAGSTVDVILTGGTIWTGDPRRPTVDAMAIAGNRIVDLGSSAQVLAHRATHTRVVDLRGRCAVPGFNDAHVHFSTGGFSLTSVQLREARSEAAFRDTLAAYVRTRPAGEWITRGEWDPEDWRPASVPTCATIDDITPEHPVFISRSDAHTALANSVAMRLAGVTAQTPDVPGGVIERFADGSPTGIFKDAATTLIERVIPRPTLAQTMAAVKAASQHAISLGVTSVADMGFVSGSIEERRALLRAYQVLRADGALDVRVSLHSPLTRWNDLASLGIMAGFGDAWLRIGALKGFADGSLGSRTALFFEPYTDAPETCGMHSDECSDASMFERMREADAAGLQLAVHAIGDRANSEVLDLYERLRREAGSRDRRARIEHVQHLRATDVARFASLGVIASMQPYHCVDDARYIERRIGDERAKGAYAFRSLLDAGAMLAFGSDWPVAPLDPLATLDAAVRRRPSDGRYPGGWMPNEKISLAEALRAYTYGSSYASFEEQCKGTFAIGKLADVAVLSEDVFVRESGAFDARAVHVDATIVDGAVAYERG